MKDPDTPVLLASLNQARAWMDEGTDRFLCAISSLEEKDYCAPSRLPNWTRKHIAGHLSANAGAVGNLVHWARTGTPTPMYMSMAQRNADIAAADRRSGNELTEWFDRSARQLSEAMAQLTPDQWSVEVLNAVGRPILAAEIAWLRARELMVHVVDLGVGQTFAELPADFLRALVADVAAMRGALGAGPALSLEGTDEEGSWLVQGHGSAQPVIGSLAGLAAYLTGRGDEGVSGPDGEPAPALTDWI